MTRSSRNRKNQDGVIPSWLKNMFAIFMVIMMILILLWALPRVFPGMASWRIFAKQERAEAPVPPQQLPAAEAATVSKPDNITQQVYVFNPESAEASAAPASSAVNNQQPPEAELAAPAEQTNEPVTGSILMEFGDLGTYKTVYDTNRKQWTIGQWNENLVIPGKMNLADLKRVGGTIKFVIPADGWINNSAGELFVDGKQWDLGNYGEVGRMTKETLILKGQEVIVRYGPNNDSAGFQIWFK